MKKIIFIFSGWFAMSSSFAATSMAETASSDPLAERSAYLARLSEEIAEIDSELTRCKKANNNWKIATAIGAVGIVGSAVGIGIQASMIKNMGPKSGENKTDVKEDVKKAE
jgi:hypothetical protein